MEKREPTWLLVLYVLLLMIGLAGMVNGIAIGAYALGLAFRAVIPVAALLLIWEWRVRRRAQAARQGLARAEPPRSGPDPTPGDDHAAG